MVYFSVTSPGLLRSIPVVTSIEIDRETLGPKKYRSRNWYLRKAGRLGPVVYSETIDDALEEAGLK